MNNNNTDIEKKIKIEKDIGNTEKENVKNENLVMYVDKFLYY